MLDEFLENNDLSYFPIPYNSKKPFKGKSWNPRKKEQIRPTSKSNLAIKMIGGVFTIDIDEKERVEEAKKIMTKHTPTYMEESPRGLHIEIRAPFPIAKRMKQGGIDVIGEGGYVLTSGSCVDGVEYTTLAKEDIASYTKEEIERSS